MRGSCYIFLVIMNLSLSAVLSAKPILNFQLGFLENVGNNSGAEASANPAYLARDVDRLQSRTATGLSASMKRTDVNLINGDESFSGFVVSGQSGYSESGFDRNFGFGVSIEGNMTSAPVSGTSSNNPALQFSSDNIINTFSANLAMGYRLNDQDSLGLRIQTSYNSESSQENGSLATYTNTVSKKSSLLGVGLAFSWLTVAKDSEFGVVVTLPGSVFASGDVTGNETSTATGFPRSGNAAGSFQYFTPPTVGLGVSQQFFSFLTVYFDATLTSPWTFSQTEFEYNTGTAYTLTGDQKSDASLSTGAGISVELNDDWTINTGARLSNAKTDNRLLTTDLTNQTLKDIKLSFFSFSSGVTYRINRLYLSSSLGISQIFVWQNRTQNLNSVFSQSNTTINQIDLFLTMGVQYVF